MSNKRRRKQKSGMKAEVKSEEKPTGVMISAQEGNAGYAVPFVTTIEKVSKAIREFQDRQVKRGVIC